MGNTSGSFHNKPTSLVFSICCLPITLNTNVGRDRNCATHRGSLTFPHSFYWCLSPFLTVVWVYMCFLAESWGKKEEYLECHTQGYIAVKHIIEVGKNEIETKNACYFNSF